MNPTLKSALILSALSFVACEKDDDNNQNPTTGKYENGTLVINEGPFMAGSGSITFMNNNGSTVEQEAFLNANGFPAGNILNSAEYIGNKLYVVANGSGRIEKVNKKTLVSEAVTSAIASPRYVADIIGNQIAVSDWGSDKVYFLDVEDLTVNAEVSVGVGPERMVSNGTDLIVLNSGGFGRDSTISVVSQIGEEILNTIVVGDIPNSAVLVDGKLWVLCSGYADWADPTQDTEGKLVKINAGTFAVEDEYPIDLAIGHPGEMVYDEANDQFCFLNNGYGGRVLSISRSNPSVINELKGGNYYSLDYDSNRDYLVAGNAVDFQNSGWMLRFNSSMELVDSTQVGLIPTDFVFD